jgi:ribosomal protein S25
VTVTIKQTVARAVLSSLNDRGQIVEQYTQICNDGFEHKVRKALTLSRRELVRVFKEVENCI